MPATGEILAVADAPTPIRTCVGCRATNAQGRLLRFVRRDDGHVIPGNSTRACDINGRGAYLCPRRACFDQAVKRRAFARSFGSGRRRVSVIDVDADALWSATSEQLRREIDLLGRTSENPHAHPRRRGLEQLLSELSSQPKPPERSASKRGPKQPLAEQPQANGTPANNERREPQTPTEGGAPNHG